MSDVQNIPNILLTLKDGTTIKCTVHGSGGVVQGVGAVARIRQAIKRGLAGLDTELAGNAQKSLLIYEGKSLCAYAMPIDRISYVQSVETI